MSKRPTSSSTAPSPAALRMRLHRERRHKNLRSLTIELRETEIDQLVRRGLLNGEMRGDLLAVRDALHMFLDQILN
jgi:hypothetical protein